MSTFIAKNLFIPTFVIMWNIALKALDVFLLIANIEDINFFQLIITTHKYPGTKSLRYVPVSSGGLALVNRTSLSKSVWNSIFVFFDELTSIYKCMYYFVHINCKNYIDLSLGYAQLWSHKHATASKRYQRTVLRFMKTKFGQKIFSVFKY